MKIIIGLLIVIGIFCIYKIVKEFRKKVSSNLDENEIKKIVELLEKVAFNMEN